MITRSKVVLLENGLYFALSVFMANWRKVLQSYIIERFTNLTTIQPLSLDPKKHQSLAKC